MAEIQVKGFSFESIKEKSKVSFEPRLFTLLCGIRGQGKSVAIGTLNLPTLLITSAWESHSIESAKLYGGDNIKFEYYDVSDDNKHLKADAAIANLHNILDFLINSEETLNNVSVVAIDSTKAIDNTLLETVKVRQANGFDAPKIMEQEHLRIIKKLKELHRKGLHILATMPILGSFDENNLYVSAKPELRGITTTSSIAGNFDDILVIAKIGVDQYAFQMDIMLKKQGKEVTGADKQIVFCPRITGLSSQDLVLNTEGSLLLPADLNHIYQLKLAKFNSKN